MDATRSAGLVHDHGIEAGQLGREPLPDPARRAPRWWGSRARRSRSGSDGRAASCSGSKARGELGEVHDPPRLAGRRRRRRAPSPGRSARAGGRTCGPGRRWAAGGPPRSGTRGRAPSRDPEVLVRLHAQPPLRDGRGSSRWPASVLASRSGPSIGCSKKWSKARSRSRPGRRRSAGYTSLSSSPGCDQRSRARLRAHAHPVDARGRRDRAVGLDRDRRTRASCSASISAASSCSSGSPPVQTTRRRLAVAVGAVRPPGPRRRRRGRRRVSKRPPPGPSVPTKSVSQNWQTAMARCAPGPSRGCSRRSGRRPRPGPALRALALQGEEQLLDR